MVTVALLQLDLRESEGLPQREAAVAQLLGALPPGVELAVLPELWTVGAFSKELKASAQPLDGPFAGSMSAAARERGIWLHAGSFVEQQPDGAFSNTSLLFDPGGEMVALYRKIHTFGFGEGEADLLTAGDEVVVVETPLGLTGLSTCYDLRFPELYRRQRELGAECFMIPAGWPSARIEHWDALLRARAIENQAVVLACNCTGDSAGVSLGGHSDVLDHDGRALGSWQDSTLVADVAIADTQERRRRFPVHDDRRLGAMRG